MMLKRTRIVMMGALCWMGFSTIAGASLMPPDCVCAVTAKVVAVQERTIIQDQTKLAAVGLKVEVVKVDGMVRSGMSPGSTCDQYKPGKPLEFEVLRDRDLLDPKAIFATGKTIKANFERSGDENGTWYNVDKVNLAQ